ncbi:tRNA 2-thiouridine(34) synthase MnmA [Candidatus Uhrbacteria bacterium]|nr:tRNA 2-thiouridine(34) synthase MnmA [Candidatus Uhrbacteria bacterium]
MTGMKPKVLVGMSGGVDSSVSAALLLEQGYEVIGAFMKNWSGDVEGPQCVDPDKVGEGFSECGWRQERRDAMRVAAQLSIPFLTFDFEEQYRRDVVDAMFREYAAGRTPNPDVMCNRFVKFDLFVKEADKLGCAFVATGHYARIVSSSSLRGPAGAGPWPARRGTKQSPEPYRILAGTDVNKDQTYFLWAVPSAVLSRVLFPIGHLTKPQVREKAHALGLLVADKKDSTGICFVGEVDIRSFLQARIPKNPGDIVTTDGAVVGRHEGIAFYTIGQREGLNIGGQPQPYYVVEKRAKMNQLVVSSNFHQVLFKTELTATECNWFQAPEEGKTYQARVRYRQQLQPCTVSIPLLAKEGLGEVAGEGFPSSSLPLTKGETGGGPASSVHVTFTQPQRAITPGQSVVFYNGEEMIGGGIIE